MKVLRSSLWLLFSGLLFSLISVTQAAQYDPLKTESGKSAVPIDLTMQDQSRNRDIPLRIYLPKSKQPAPVVLFSHGLGGARTGSQYLGEHWSARGYVVVYLQHPGSDEAVWKDVPILQRLRALKSATTLQNTVDRYQDVSAVLDQLTRWNDESQHQFHQRMDLSRIGMSGHSYGAVTTQGVSGQSWRLLGKRYTDPRIKAAVMFSPSIHGRAEPADSFGQVSIPWMLLTGTKDTSPINDTTVTDRREVYQGLPDSIDKYELVLFDAQHSAFSDGRQRRGLARRNPNHHKSILAVTTAFWDTYLLDSKQARQWLQGKACREQLDPEDEWQLEVSKTEPVKP
ncbi:Alpha/beta hydrolase family protein [Gimesia chilikensis]|uniref:Alpha/beta hydrolase family protein n=1 Tax=Gimesia chilikensis TaxID=2605989 RepID=A0A517WKX5_9PLAN|nr:CocE/NonD family hydrolase [Gimesia chilikensis]QDU05917.1 Alpha/beta hydrolase family protein [Gimesia chilikensis]